MEDYRGKALKITGRDLLDSFSFLVNQENTHSLLIGAIAGSGSIGEARGELVAALSIYADELAQIMGRSWPDYVQHFQDNARPDLEEFSDKVQPLVPEIQEALLRIGSLLNLQWHERYVVYIVEPTSMDFKPCGDALYRLGAVAEAHLDLGNKDVVDLVVHELTHSTFDLTILKLVHERLRKDFEYVDEAIVFLIVDAVIHNLKASPKPEGYEDQRSRKVAFYAAKFWDKWQERLQSKRKLEPFEDFLMKLLSDES